MPSNRKWRGPQNDKNELPLLGPLTTAPMTVLFEQTLDVTQQLATVPRRAAGKGLLDYRASGM